MSKHYVLVRYEMNTEPYKTAILNTRKIEFVGHSMDEINNKLKELNCHKEGIAYAEVQGDRPGDWEDALVNDEFAFEIEESL